MNQVEEKIKQMKDELPRLIESSYSLNYVSIKDDSPENAWMRGRSSAIFEALAVIDFLRAVLKDQRQNAIDATNAMAKARREKNDAIDKAQLNSEVLHSKLIEFIEIAKDFQNEVSDCELNDINLGLLPQPKVAAYFLNVASMINKLGSDLYEM